MAAYLFGLALCLIPLTLLAGTLQAAFELARRVVTLRAATFSVSATSLRPGEKIEARARVVPRGKRQVTVHARLTCTMFDHRSHRLYASSLAMVPSPRTGEQRGDQYAVSLRLPEYALRTGLVGDSPHADGNSRRMLVVWTVDFQVRAADGTVLRRASRGFEVPRGRRPKTHLRRMSLLAIDTFSSIRNDMLFNWLVHLAACDGAITSAERRFLHDVLEEMTGMTDGPDTPNGQRAFHLGAEGVGRLFAAVYSDPDEKHPGYPRDVAYVPKDGPLPEMYEPVESPVENVLHPGVNSNPMLKYPRVASHQPIGTVDKFPYVLMTSTVAEHWCAGSTTRNIPWLNELVPEPVLELPVALAQTLEVKSGDWVRVSSARGELEVKALVTPRMKELKIGDQEVTIVWMPYNWGFQGLSTGPSVNHLTIDASDPGAGTQETKACLVNVVKAKASAPGAKKERRS